MKGASVVLLPGFGGRPSQPILVRLARRLEALGWQCHRLAPPRGRVTPELGTQVEWLEAQLAALPAPRVLVGRSFGGRVALRAAKKGQVAAVVALGFPIRPKGKRRPLDERALAEAEVPVLVVQGTRDELGPLAVVRAAARRNHKVEVLPLSGAGHSFGRRESEALDAAAAWLDAQLG